MSFRRRVVVIAGLAGVPAAGDDSHSVTVLNIHSDVAAEFHSAKCNKLKDGRFVATTKRVNGYKLIDAFEASVCTTSAQGRT